MQELYSEVRNRILAGQVKRIVILSSPRSGSTFLRLGLLGNIRSYGELLVRGGQNIDVLAFQKNIADGITTWDSVIEIPIGPSLDPNGISYKDLNDYNSEAPVSVKLIAAQIFRNSRLFLSLLNTAEIVIELIPTSFSRQIKSMSRIHRGADAHSYLDDKADKSERARANASEKDSLTFRAFFQIFTNNLVRKVLRVFYRRRKSCLYLLVPQDGISEFVDYMNSKKIT